MYEGPLDGSTSRKGQGGSGELAESASLSSPPSADTELLPCSLCFLSLKGADDSQKTLDHFFSDTEMARPPKGLASAGPGSWRGGGEGVDCQKKALASSRPPDKQLVAQAERRLLELQRELLVEKESSPTHRQRNSLAARPRSSREELAGGAFSPSSLWLAADASFAAPPEDEEEELSRRDEKEKAEQLRRRLEAHRVSPSHCAFRELTEKLESPENAKSAAIVRLVDGAAAVSESPRRFLGTTERERRGREGTRPLGEATSAAVESLRLAQVLARAEELGRKAKAAQRLEAVRRESEFHRERLRESVGRRSQRVCVLKQQTSGEESQALALERRLRAVAESALHSQKTFKRISKAAASRAKPAAETPSPSLASRPPLPGVTVRLRSVNFCSVCTPQSMHREPRQECAEKSASRREPPSENLPVVSYCVVARYGSASGGEDGSALEGLPSFTTAWYQAFVVRRPRRAATEGEEEASALEKKDAELGKPFLKSGSDVLCEESCVFDTELTLPALPPALQASADSRVVRLSIWRKETPRTPPVATAQAEAKRGPDLSDAETDGEVALAGEASLDLQDPKCFDPARCVFPITPPCQSQGDDDALCHLLARAPRLGTLHASVASFVVCQRAPLKAPTSLHPTKISAQQPRNSGSPRERSWLYIVGLGCESLFRGPLRLCKNLRLRVWRLCTQDDFGKLQGPFSSTQMFGWICKEAPAFLFFYRASLPPTAEARSPSDAGVRLCLACFAGDRYFEDSTVVFESTRPSEPTELRLVAKSIAEEARRRRSREEGGGLLGGKDAIADADANQDVVAKSCQAEPPSACLPPTAETGDREDPLQLHFLKAKRPSPSAVREVWRSLEEASRCLGDVRRHRMSNYLRCSIAAPSPEASALRPQTTRPSENVKDDEGRRECTFSSQMQLLTTGTSTLDFSFAEKKTAPPRAPTPAPRQSLSRVYIHQRFKLLRDTFGDAALREACAVYIQAAFRGWRVRRRFDGRRRRPLRGVSRLGVDQRPFG